MDNNVKITVKANKGILVDYRTAQRKTIVRLKLPSSEIKNVLKLLASEFGNSGYFSISSVYEFVDNMILDRYTVRLAESSLMGPIISLNSRNGNYETMLLSERYTTDLHSVKSVDDLSLKQIIIDTDISKDGLLHTKILEYINVNGIFINKNHRVTYGDMMTGKSNNYKKYSEAFIQITGSDILSKQSISYTPDNLQTQKISFIIPCYNTKETINKTLLSIDNQQIEKEVLRNAEVILIDDASDDPIKNHIIDRDYLFNLKIIRLENNVGISIARNIGVTYSTGDILIFLDSDVLISKNYVREHLIRNIIIPNAVFISFKENVNLSDKRINEKSIINGLNLPDYSNDLRIHKHVKKGAIGSYEVEENTDVEILEATNYFKAFHGSQNFGVYDLSCMVTGHNFSTSKNVIIRSNPFSDKFKGWGMEDVYFGLKIINDGNFIIPILSAGVYHLNHPLRSGNKEKKNNEYMKNTEIIDKFLKTEIGSDI